MPIPLDAPEVLDREYLVIRAKLLEIASALDRIDRGEGTAAGDPRTGQIREALEILLGESPDRAEQVQLLFSRQYEDDWQEKYEMPKPK